MTADNDQLHEICCSDPDALAVVTRLYEQSLFRFADRPSFRSDGRPARWALDLRRPLSTGDILSLTSNVVGGLIRAEAITQIACIGVGGATLLGALLAANPTWRGGVVRETRKQYGFREIVEGSLVRDAPIALIDDILSSGRTSVKAIALLREQGFQPTFLFPLFHFAWRKGEVRLNQAGVHVRPLAALTYRPLAANTAVTWPQGGAWTVRLP